MNRRTFVKVSASGIAGIPLLVSSTTSAQDLVELSEEDPTAVALGYKALASEVDTTTYPNFTDEQLCSNCSLYQGAQGEAVGPCAIFPGKSVTADGWCSVWAPLPS